MCLWALDAFDNRYLKVRQILLRAAMRLRLCLSSNPVICTTGSLKRRKLFILMRMLKVNVNANVKGQSSVNDKDQCNSNVKGQC